MNKSLWTFCIFVLALGLLVIPAWAQETETVKSILLMDDLDREVEIPAELSSIVTLAPSLTETVAALNGLDLITACDINSNYPQKIEDLDKVTDWGMIINYEMLVEKQPDLILASEMTALEQIKDMENLGLTVFCIKNPADFQELFEKILIVGMILDENEAAAELVDQLETRVNAVAEAMKSDENIPVVFYELDATDITKPWTAGAGTFISEIVKLAGGKNLGDELEGAWVQMGLEALIDADPEIILLGDAAYGNSPDAVAARTGWGDLSAVADGKLFEFDDNLVSRPGPRLVDGLETIAQILHPELFTE